MVHLSAVNFLRIANYSRTPNPGRTNFFKKQQIFRLSAKYFGRKRNCYTLALRKVHDALSHATHARNQKTRLKNFIEIWKQRLDAACRELGYDYSTLLVGMLNSNIVLNRRVLSDLAIWEPRTFKSLLSIAATNVFLENSKKGFNGLKPPPDGVITRGML